MTKTRIGPRRLIRRVALFAVAACVVATIWSVLGRTRSNDGRRVVIRIAHWQTESGPRDGMSALIARYEQLHPDVRVVQMVIPGGIYPQWLQTQLAGGTVPDIVEYGHWFGRAAELEGKYFEPLDRWLQEPNPYNRGTDLEHMRWRDTFLDGLDNLNCYNPQMDRFFGISLCTDTLRLYYNRPLLRAITGSERPPENYREFMKLCDDVRDYARKNRLRLVPLAGSKDTVVRLSDALLASTTMKVVYGLDRLHRLRLESVEAALAYLQGEWRYPDPAFIAGLQLSREYCQQLDPGALQLDRTSATSAFANGNAVMFATGSFDACSLLTLCSFPIGACRLPRPVPADPDYGRYVPGIYSDGQVGTTFALYLLRTSQHQAVALDFMRFITSQAGVQKFADTSNWLPGVVGVKPTAYSSQYMPDPDGYGPGASLSLLSGAEAFGLFNRNIFALVGPDGSPERFARLMEETLPERISADIEHVLREATQNSNQQDVMLAARHFWQRSTGQADEKGDSSGTLSEALAYRYRYSFEEAEKKTP